MDSGWMDAYKVALVIGATAQLLFVIVYSTRPWWKHYVGKALFFKSLALCVALIVSVGNIVFTPYPYQLQIAVISIWFVAITIVGQCVALIVQVGHDRYDKQKAEQRSRVASKQEDI